MPGSGFKHQAFHVKTLVRKTLDTPYEMVKRAMVSSQKFFFGSQSPQLNGCGRWREQQRLR